MHGHQALRHRHLGKVADAPEVVRVAQRHDAAAVLAGAGNAQLHGLHAGDLAVAALAVQREQRASVEQHLHARIGRQATFEHGVHIARHHAHAVRVVATQVGHDQVVGHLGRLGRGAARFFDDACNFGAQVLCRNRMTHGFFRLSLGHSSPSTSSGRTVQGLAWLSPNGFGIHITAPTCQGTNSFCP